MDFDKKFHKPIYKEKGVFFETSPRKVYNIFLRAAGEAVMKTGFNQFLQNICCGFLWNSARKVYIIFIGVHHYQLQEKQMWKQFSIDLYRICDVVFFQTAREKINISNSRAALLSAAGGADMKTGSTLFVHTADTVGVHCTVPVCQDLKENNHVLWSVFLWFFKWEESKAATRIAK